MASPLPNAIGPDRYQETTEKVLSHRRKTSFREVGWHVHGHRANYITWGYELGVYTSIINPIIIEDGTSGSLHWTQGGAQNKLVQ